MPMKRFPVLGASICLLLDILGFIVVSLIAFASTNLFLIALSALFIFAFAFDATKATVYICNHFKK
jgi:hypothetical protein